MRDKTDNLIFCHQLFCKIEGVSAKFKIFAYFCGQCLNESKGLNFRKGRVSAISAKARKLGVII